MGNRSIPQGESAWRLGAATLICAQFALFLGLGLSRHWGYMTSLNDLGVFDQAVWGILNGSPFLNTISLDRPANLLGIHFSPILAVFAPLYAVQPRVEWFMLAQAVALSLAAWPIFLLARQVSQSERTAFLWTLAYAVNPFLLNAAAWDFHPIFLSVPFMALGFLAVERKEARLLAVCCLALLTVQEHLGLAIAGFGGLWWRRHQDWRLGLLLVAVAAAQVFLVLGVLMPALSPTHSHPMMSSDLGQMSRYGWIGHSPGEIAGTAATRPAWLVKTVLWDMGGAPYVGLLLLPFLFLAAAAPAFLLPGLGDLAANLLSANPMPRGWASYHSVNLLPVLAVASIYGARRVCAWQQRFNQGELAAVAAAVSLVLGYLLAPLPLLGARNFWSPNAVATAPDPTLPALIEAMPKQASASVQGNVGANFSQRQNVYFFPAGLGKADIVVLRLESPTTRLHPDGPAEIATLAHHLQMAPTAYLDKVAGLLDDRRYGVLQWRDPWLVLARGEASASLQERREILAKLARLKQAWHRPAPGDREEERTR